jgi:hypothetical protein
MANQLPNYAITAECRTETKQRANGMYEGVRALLTSVVDCEQLDDLHGCGGCRTFLMRFEWDIRWRCGTIYKSICGDLYLSLSS